MSTLCPSIVSHATLILFYHAPALTLQPSLISRALWLPQSMILQSLECSVECDKLAWENLIAHISVVIVHLYTNILFKYLRDIVTGNPLLEAKDE